MKLQKNLKMNSQTYDLRREIISVIYEAKAIGFDLPRIQVRVSESHDRILGQAIMGRCEIYIPESTVKNDRSYLRQVVLHEILHAVKAVEHVPGCPLMGAVVSEVLTKEKAYELFKKYLTAFC
jgi:hypothetical protein